ncbi:metal ABC transporter substrate-binding protein [Myxosarcina sp. GI1]|uniref:metal ABC transporter substrate-binding protein n=1 Tax=Myxosarcina sp. GI1 TaxID=1541065 RepID=UPI00055B6579|nr:metal ABC transporter substrate-binding protein [Myxosarcina sp. GI1]
MAETFFRRSIILFFSITLSMWLTGCDGTEQTSSTASSNSTSTTDVASDSSTDKKKVLTTFSVLADIAQNVAGDKLNVESITRIGAEIHGYEPTPSDIVKVQNADLILYNGMDLERWFEQFLGNVKGVPSALLTEGIEPIPISEGSYTNKPNPHAWMSPRNALVYVENIRQAFVKLDPENADTYNANAKAYSAKLSTIDETLEADLSKVPEQQRYLVSCEGAFSYLARDYDMEEIYIWPINAEQQYTPKQIQRVIEEVKTNNIPTIFCETTVSDEGQKQVAQTTGANFGGNLYVDSLSNKEGAVPTFIDLLEYDARTITNGLLAGSNTGKQ